MPNKNEKGAALMGSTVKDFKKADLPKLYAIRLPSSEARRETTSLRESQYTECVLETAVKRHFLLNEIRVDSQCYSLLSPTSLTVKITLVRTPVNPINEFNLVYGETPQRKQNSQIDYCGKHDR